MKSDVITFADLEKLLVQLGFTDLHHPKYKIFEHPHEKAMISLQGYAPNDIVRPADLVSTRGTLEAYGLLNREAFDGLTEKVTS